MPAKIAAINIPGKHTDNSQTTVGVPYAKTVWNSGKPYALIPSETVCNSTWWEYAGKPGEKKPKTVGNSVDQYKTVRHKASGTTPKIARS
jgi:hypothetical protein